MFLICLCQWRDRNLKYQLRKAIGRFLLLLYVTIFGCFQGYSYVTGGCWWTYFAVLSVTLNDASAYFAGRFFGKR